MTKKVRRLYEQFKPEHYQLDLDVDPDKMTFSGTVTIRGHKSGRPSSRLTLHQKALTITKARLTRHEKKADHEISVDRINNHKSYDEVRLHSKDMLYPGRYTLVIEFKGKITRLMNGIYPCFFTEDGKEKKLIATQFESHHAREAFPCIDEPEAKATFDLTLRTPKELTAISNTPVKNQTTDKSKLITSFETTPKMSTYLLAFVFGELQYREAKTKDGVIVRTYATAAHVESTSFALEVAVRCLEFYNDYFGIDYPLEKCDMVALPDFASGAMENWGCITYREQTMLVDPHNTSLSTKQYVAMVVAHELAHQWFGNLVTMRWWTDLWLNEGFASWIEYMAVDHIFPEWQMWTQFVADEQQHALKLDALEHTHAIEAPIEHPDEIPTIFDAISYAKGSSVIHMLHEYLGKRDFREGLRFYLEKHAYGNTNTIDLWEALEEASEKPVRGFMHAWTAQAGYPLVRAEVNEDGLRLEQRRFYLNPRAAKRDHGNERWPVALLAGKDLPEIFNDRTHKLAKASSGLKLNSHQSGFYRVVYNASHTERLGELIKKGHLEPLDRLGILADSFEAAKAGYAGTTDALHLVETYEDEDNAAVWEIIAVSLAVVRSVMNDEELRELMKPYTRHLVAKQLKRLGWRESRGESHLDKLLRPTILGMAALAEEPAVVREALRLFKNMHHSEDLPPDLRTAGSRSQVKTGSLDPDIRGVVYGTVAREGGGAEYDKLFKLYQHTTSSEEHLTIAAALTGFKQPELIERSLGYINSKHVRLQDVAYWVAYSFSNRHARDASWKWLKHNWPWLVTNIGTDMSFYRFPLYIARAYSDEAFLGEYKEFFGKVRSTGLDRSIKQGIETIEWQADWRARDFKTIKAFFAKH